MVPKQYSCTDAAEDPVAALPGVPEFCCDVA